MLKRSILYIFLGITSLIAQTFTVSNTHELRSALENAQRNQQDDTIILKKAIYKTTDDGAGTFVFTDDENTNLTIMSESGLSAADVVLYGNKQDNVLKLSNSIKGTKVFLKNISIVNGKQQGINALVYLDIDSCKINHNGMLDDAINGGGITATKGLKIKNSEVSYNEGRNGAGIYATYNASYNDNGINISILNSYIHHNSIGPKRGGFGAGIYLNGNAEIIHSHIDSNSLSSWGFAYGGGIYLDGISLPLYNIDKSRISNNIVYDTANGDYYGQGAGIFIKYGSLQLTNSILDHNKKAEAIHFYSSDGEQNIINNTIIDNNIAEGVDNSLYIYGNIINNIFDNNGGKIYIKADSNFYNNYYQRSELDRGTANVEVKNSRTSGNLAFHDNYRLTSLSDAAINYGLNPDSNTFRDLIDPGFYPLLLANLKLDYTECSRISGITIDIGAYEYNPPHADEGPDKRVQVNKPVTIEGKGNCGIVSYEWRKDDGTLMTTNSSFTYTPDTIGVDTFTLTVTNYEGITDSDSMKVTVTEFPPFDVPPILYLLF